MTEEQEKQESINSRSAIDQSARFPVLFFITSASLWLLLAATLGFIQQMKMHNPSFLDHPWLYFLNYGRSNPAFMTSLVYGWSIQAGMGVAIWIMARLCSAEVKNPLTLIVAGHCLKPFCCVQKVVSTSSPNKSICWMFAWWWHS